ncbi:hypothetical protein Cgig2_032638 [Carnegiea gigantea]|uniref:Uncharacterized protein n=1 Tax=Carnegiea gigantea TaxID=171969 RepID=A0A9Q1KWW5_9CARY|nr:hypothetical protein Cgig2_032638 [Carnegiea gigantea]
MAGLHASPDLVPHESTTVYPGMPQGYFDQRMHLSGRQNPMLFNALETTNAPLHSEFHPYPASQPRWFNEFAIGSSAPNMSQMMLGPCMWRNVPQFPFTVNSNVRTEVPVERGQVPAMGPAFEAASYCLEEFTSLPLLRGKSRVRGEGLGSCFVKANRRSLWVLIPRIDDRDLEDHVTEGRERE